MYFENTRSIYEQIGDFLVDRILRHEVSADERLPSVRDLAVELGVNPNTVQRSYSHLQDEGLIYNQRGVGYFVAGDAFERALAARRSRFESQMLPQVFETMDVLRMTPRDLEPAWRSWRAGENGGER